MKQQPKITILESEGLDAALDAKLAVEVACILLQNQRSGHEEWGVVSAVEQGPIGRVDQRTKARIIEIGARQKNNHRP